MGRPPCREDEGLKKGPWTPEEDMKLVDYIQKNGHGSWRALPKNAGLNRCGKSCCLRWTNYLRPDIRRGKFSDEEERLIIQLHSSLGNKWSAIAARLPGRTDNEIKNYWNTHLKKRLLHMGIDPMTHGPRTDLNILANLQNLSSASGFGSLQQGASGIDNALRIQADAAQVARIQILHTLIQALVQSSAPNIDLVAAMISQPVRLFGGLFSEESQDNTSLTSMSTPTTQGTLPVANSPFASPPSKENFGVENSRSISASPMSSSDRFSLDQFQEMISSHEGLSSSFLEPWDAPVDTESYDLFWRDLLA